MSVKKENEVFDMVEKQLRMFSLDARTKNRIVAETSRSNTPMSEIIKIYSAMKQEKDSGGDFDPGAFVEKFYTVEE